MRLPLKKDGLSRAQRHHLYTLEKSTTFIKHEFDRGVKSGRHSKAHHVVDLMKTARTEEGTLLAKLHEHLDELQIKGLFLKYPREQKKILAKVTFQVFKN